MAALKALLTVADYLQYNALLKRCDIALSKIFESFIAAGAWTGNASLKTLLEILALCSKFKGSVPRSVNAIFNSLTRLSVDKCLGLLEGVFDIDGAKDTVPKDFRSDLFDCVLQCRKRARTA